MAKNTAGSYHRTTIYLTDEQWRWLSPTRSPGTPITPVRSETSDIQDERDVPCPKARPDPTVTGGAGLTVPPRGEPKQSEVCRMGQRWAADHPERQSAMSH